MNRFEKEIRIGSITLKNRIIRSATYEGMADLNGDPGPEFKAFYDELGRSGAGALITGFMFVSRDGRAMQPAQCGLESDRVVPVFMRITDSVHEKGGKIFAQIAHTGRQTMRSVTGGFLYSSSDKRSIYFRGKPDPLSMAEIERIVKDFGLSACRAKEAGFDGVQVHAAHGYLIHQFLHPAVNFRTDRYAIDERFGIGTRFLSEIINEIRKQCGYDFPVLVKISGSDDLWPSMKKSQLQALVSFLDRIPVDAIEVSYGTMDHAFNIFRGDVPLEAILSHNPFFRAEPGFKREIYSKITIPVLRKWLKPFTHAYNLKYASFAKKFTKKPIISVGGFRNLPQIEAALSLGHADMIALCRPFIAEPDFLHKLRKDNEHKSRCTNCNICAVMCDSGRATRCYRRKNG